MKNNIVFFVLFAISTSFLCASQTKIRYVEIMDDNFVFDTAGFSKTYKVASNLESLNIGIIFDEPIPESNIEDGILEVGFLLENGNKMTFTLASISKICYSSFKDKLVNKIFLSPIDLEERFFIKEVQVSVKQPLRICSKTCLFLTNSGTRLFFDN